MLYDQTLSRVETYFDKTASKTWEQLTSDAPVSKIRQTVRAGRDRMRHKLLNRLPQELVGARILDAGCGTGLVAVELKKMGYKNFYGADISQKLLDLAPQGLYKSLERIDLNKKLIYEDDKFDSVFCVGTFTFGHVKPDALDEFIRITKKNGLICFTINVGVYKDYGFDKKINNLIDNDKWKKLEFFKSNYLSSKDVNAWLGIYKVTK